MPFTLMKLMCSGSTLAPCMRKVSAERDSGFKDSREQFRKQ